MVAIAKHTAVAPSGERLREDRCGVFAGKLCGAHLSVLEVRFSPWGAI